MGNRGGNFKRGRGAETAGKGGGGSQEESGKRAGGGRNGKTAWGRDFWPGPGIDARLRFVQ